MLGRFFKNNKSTNNGFVVQVEEEDENVFTRQEPDKPIMYKSRPPPYPVIVGIRARDAGILNNLMASFVDMDAKNGGVGDVYTLEGVAGFF